MSSRQLAGRRKPILRPVFKIPVCWASDLDMNALPWCGNRSTAKPAMCQKYSMSGQQTPDEGLQDVIEAIVQNVNEARDRIGTGDHSSEELQRAITKIMEGRTALINHIRRHMPEALEGELIQELEENERTDEELPERDIEAVRASLRSLAVHAQRARADIEQLQQGIREIIDSGLFAG